MKIWGDREFQTRRDFVRWNGSDTGFTNQKRKILPRDNEEESWAPSPEASRRHVPSAGSVPSLWQLLIGRASEWVNEQMNEWVNEWMNEWVNEWTHEQTGEWVRQMSHWFRETDQSLGRGVRGCRTWEHLSISGNHQQSASQSTV